MALLYLQQSVDPLLQKLTRRWIFLFYVHCIIGLVYQFYEYPMQSSCWIEWYCPDRFWHPVRPWALQHIEFHNLNSPNTDESLDAEKKA